MKPAGTVNKNEIKKPAPVIPSYKEYDVEVNIPPQLMETISFYQNGKEVVNMPNFVSRDVKDKNKEVQVLIEVPEMMKQEPAVKDPKLNYDPKVLFDKNEYDLKAYKGIFEVLVKIGAQKVYAVGHG